MDVPDYISFVASEGELFASAAARGELDVEVPPCPGWDMRELVRHLGLIHLWAASHLAFPREEPDFGIEMPALASYWPDLGGSWPDDGNLVSWYRETNANLVRALETAPPDVEAFTFLPAPTPRAMWARRQASEIAIHRFDAQVSRGMNSRFDARFAGDMLDELLSGFAPSSRPIEVDAERQLHAHANDIGERWCLTIGPRGVQSSRDAEDPDLTVTGSAAELYLLFWNRTPDTSVHMTGDESLMDLWHNNCRVRWS